MGMLSKNIARARGAKLRGPNWNPHLESWWQKKASTFPGGLVNAVWHMPDATARRMTWLESLITELMTPTRYKSERLKRGLSQAALAELVGVSRGCINYREAGHPRYPITREAWLAMQALPMPKKKKAQHPHK